jgi:hypothetical protein
MKKKPIAKSKLIKPFVIYINENQKKALQKQATQENFLNVSKLIINKLIEDEKTN